MDPQGHNLSDMRRKKGDFERLRKKLGKGDLLELVFFASILFIAGYRERGLFW